MNKKILTLSILSLFLFSMFIGFVDAEIEYTRKLNSPCERGLIVPWLMGTDCGKGLVCGPDNICVNRDSLDLKGKVPGFLEGVLVSEGNNLVYDRLIMFILILTVIFGVLSTVNIFGTKRKPNKGMVINLIISASLGLLGIRFLPKNWISFLATPATAMVALITAGMPFLIVHIITGKWLRDKHKISGVKTIWAVYLLFMVGLLINNFRTQKASVGSFSPNIVVILFIIFGFLEMIFTDWRFSRELKNFKNEAKNIANTAVTEAIAAKELADAAKEVDRTKVGG